MTLIFLAGEAELRGGSSVQCCEWPRELFEYPGRGCLELPTSRGGGTSLALVRCSSPSL